VFTYKTTFIILITTVGLIGALLAGKSFAPPIGGALGALVGIALSIHASSSSSSQGKHFSVYVKTSPYGGPVKQDSRFVTTFIIAIIGGISAFLWQMLLLMFGFFK